MVLSSTGWTKVVIASCTSSSPVPTPHVNVVTLYITRGGVGPTIERLVPGVTTPLAAVVVDHTHPLPVPRARFVLVPDRVRYLLVHDPLAPDVHVLTLHT